MALIAQIPPRATRKACRDGLAEMIRYHRVPKDLPKEETPQQIYYSRSGRSRKGLDWEIRNRWFGNS